MDDGAKELQTRLADLHRQLQTTGKVDPESREMLVEVLSDIARVLEFDTQLGQASSLGGAAIEPQNLTQRLSDAARQFEDTHPNLSATIGSVITALSRTGI